jgi:hypothetical protein
MWNKICAIIVGIALFTSCGARKQVITTSSSVENKITPTNENADYLINNLDFHSFSGRAKAKVELGNDNQDVTMHVRIQRNKAIWISLTGSFLNVEGARLLITPDSVKIMNKLQGEYTVKPFNFIHRYTGEGVSFGVLQDLLIANVSSDLLRTDQMTVAKATDDVQLVGVKNNLSFQYSLNGKFRPKVIRLTAVGSSQNLEAFYSSFNDVTGYNFPQNQNIKLSATGFQVNAVLNYNKIEFNQELEMPFTVPARYKVLN